MVRPGSTEISTRVFSPRAMMLGKSTACCAVMPQSSVAMIDFATYAGIKLPPGDPVTSRMSSFWSKTIVGDMDDRGLLPGTMALATGLPSVDGCRAKSVISLLSRKPCVNREEPR